MLVLEGVVQVEQFGMVQVVHDVDLVLDGVLVERIRRVDELGDETPPGRLLHRPVHHAERTAIRQQQSIVDDGLRPQRATHDRTCRSLSVAERNSVGMSAVHVVYSVIT